MNSSTLSTGSRLGFRASRRIAPLAALALVVATSAACSSSTTEARSDAAESVGASASALSLSWTSSGPGSTSVTSAGDGDVQLNYAGSANGSDGYKERHWAFQTKAPTSGDFSYSWNYSGFHAWYQATARVTAFADGPNGRTTAKLYDGSAGGGFQLKGTSALQVTGGYAFGFLVDGYNYDLNSTLQGDLHLTYSLDHVGPVVGGNNRVATLFANAPPGVYVSELRAHWDGDKIRGISWAYSDGSCSHTAPGCAWGDTAYDKYSSELRSFSPSDYVRQCFLAESGYGYGSLRSIRCSTEYQSEWQWGPNGYDYQEDQGGRGGQIVGFHGTVNPDNFMQNLAFVTRVPNSP